MFCKGADDVMIKLVNKNESPYYDKIMTDNQKYSNEGLRTLLLCERRLNLHTFEKWREQYDKAIINNHYLLGQKQEYD